MGTIIDSRLVIGCDPGRAGGLCVLLGVNVLYLRPMPETLKGIRLFIGDIVERFGPPEVAILEDLSVCPRFSRTAIMSSARHLGNLEGVFEALKVRTELVRPQTWQSLMYADPRLSGLEGKQRSIAAAKILCPDINLMATVRSRRPSDGMADAYLIARYALSWRKDDTGAA